MTVSVLHTADAWWVKTPDGAARIDTAATTTAQLLADRAAIEAAAASTDTIPVGGLKLVSPVTRPCRVVAQMTNFESHVRDAGMDPASVPLTFFRKASASINGPFDDIVKPEHVRLLDYEVEIGLVIGRAIPIGTSISDANLSEFIAGLVVHTMCGVTFSFRRRNSMRPSRIRRSPRWGRSSRCWMPRSSSGSATCGCA
jgi:2-keto-4-pentenoate hydratase/2-oxohepta-3-ene-1,7-dioic acid hydratase in catechol pathway